MLRFIGTGLPNGSLFDDDSGGGLDSFIPDTGELSGGHYCAQVSTFGDIGWNGTTQGSTGRFVFQATLLNRRPTLSLTVPGQPAWVEGGIVTLNLSFHDADTDPVSAVLVDASNATVVSQRLATATQAGSAVFTWTVPQGATTAGPYVATFTAADAPIADALVSRPISQTIAVAPLAVPTAGGPGGRRAGLDRQPGPRNSGPRRQHADQRLLRLRADDHAGALASESAPYASMKPPNPAEAESAPPVRCVVAAGRRKSPPRHQSSPKPRRTLPSGVGVAVAVRTRRWRRTW